MFFDQKITDKEFTMIWPANDVTKQITLDKLYSFFEVHRDSAFSFPGETHNFWECVYVLNGSILASGDERVYSLTKGEIIFHKPMELHKYLVDAEEGADLLIFSFSLEGPLTEALKNKVFYLSDEQQALVDSMLCYVRKKHGELPKAILELPEHQYLLPFEKHPTYSQILTTYVYQLFLSLIGDGSIATVSTAPDAKIFRKAVNYLNNQITEQPSVPEIAAFCNTSEATLKRIFDKYAGISIHKYFLKLKINVATELLQNGLRVSEVAEKLGFSSQAYFSAAYKRETGINPSSIEHS